MSLVKARARVTLTIVVPTSSSWDSDCRLDQVFQEASEEVKRRVENSINNFGGQVVGDLRIEAILTES